MFEMFSAKNAAKLFPVVMRRHVDAQIHRAFELLSTLVTHEWFFSSVISLVNVQVIFCSESCWADLASEIFNYCFSISIRFIRCVGGMTLHFK